MLTERALQTVVVEPKAAAQACVIWLHGLGADGHDFETIIPELKLPEDLAIRFIFPHAPMRKITLNGGMEMRGWYDLENFDISKLEDRPGFEQSIKLVETLIEQQAEQGIPASRIIVAGFSQGGSIALHAGLRYSQRLAGIMGLSTFLPIADELKPQIPEDNFRVPVLLLHGLFDPVVPISLAQQAKQRLEAWDFNLIWESYPMAHSVCEAESRMIGRWLKACISRALT